MSPFAGWRVGRLFGIDVRLNPFWFLLVGLVVYGLFKDGFGDPSMGLTGGQALVASVVTAMVLFASLLAHEFGHALTARAFGIPVPQITLNFFGGAAQMGAESQKPLHEFLITIAGPAVSVLLAVVFGGAFVVSLQGLPPVIQSSLFSIAATNGAWAVFNMLPGFPMDGGRVLRSALWGATGNYMMATRVAALGGRIVAAGLTTLGIIATFSMITGTSFGIISMGSPLLILLGLYLGRLARMSLVQAEVVTAFNGLTVRDLMRPVRAAVPRDWAVSDFVPLFSPPNQIDQLPVIDGDRLVGALQFSEVMNVPKRQWDWVKADELAKPFDQASMLSPGTDAFSAFLRIINAGLASMPVFEGRRLLGYVFRADLASRMPERMGGTAR